MITSHHRNLLKYIFISHPSPMIYSKHIYIYLYVRPRVRPNRPHIHPSTKKKKRRKKKYPIPLRSITSPMVQLLLLLLFSLSYIYSFFFFISALYGTTEWNNIKRRRWFSMKVLCYKRKKKKKKKCYSKVYYYKEWVRKSQMCGMASVSIASLRGYAKPMDHLAEGVCLEN